MSEPVFDLSKAVGMYEFCKYYEMGFNASKRWALKHFGLIERELRPGETVYSVFMGIYNYISATKHGNNAAYAITSQRVLIAQKNFIGEEISTVDISRISDVKMSTGIMGGIVTFDAFTEKFNVFCNKDVARRIYEHALECIRFVKEQKDNQSKADNSGLDDLKKLKELLDDGIITQEEFNAKKKQILKL